MDKKLHRANILNNHIQSWLHSSSHTQQSLAQLIIESIEKLKLNELLDAYGVKFQKRDDVYANSVIDTKRLMRWLNEAHEVKDYAQKLFAIEHAIVAVMPDEIKISYLNEIYGNSGVLLNIKPKLVASNGQLTAAAMVESVTRENSEAVVAMVNHALHQSDNTEKAALKEMNEAVGILLTAISILNKKNKDVS